MLLLTLDWSYIIGNTLSTLIGVLIAGTISYFIMKKNMEKQYGIQKTFMEKQVENDNTKMETIIKDNKEHLEREFLLKQYEHLISEVKKLSIIKFDTLPQAENVMLMLVQKKSNFIAIKLSIALFINDSSLMVFSKEENIKFNQIQEEITKELESLNFDKDKTRKRLLEYNKYIQTVLKNFGKKLAPIIKLRFK